jgi:hypothetical protein
MCIIQLVEDDLRHHAYASPKVAQGMVELLGPNWACDGRMSHPVLRTKPDIRYMWNKEVKSHI